jgi:hypothetical protein
LLWGLQLSLREQAGQIRQTPAAAVRASWKAEWARSLGFSAVVAVFLSVVGAFGSGAAPFLLRTLVFIAFGVGSGVIVACCIMAARQVAALHGRPIAQRVLVGALATIFVGLWVWAAMGFAFLHGPKLRSLPSYLGYSVVLSAAMSFISWAVFRERKTIVLAAPSSASPKFTERLPFRLRDAEIYAVEAEDHYLRVRTSKGSDLILMRFSDALLELEGVDGAQTHRSWWVARAGIADVKRSEGRAVLALKDGAVAPVSRAQAKGLREKGWL